MEQEPSLRELRELVDKQAAQIRPLTAEEQLIYSGAITAAIGYMTSFRDMAALLRPYYDATAETAYVDPYGRCGLSAWFFNRTPKQQVTVLLHEMMHLMNNHFVRGNGFQSPMSNVAGDLEINCGLATLDFTDMSDLLLPTQEPFNFPNFLSMEQYYALTISRKDELFPNSDNNAQEASSGAQSAGESPSAEQQEQGSQKGSESAQEGNAGGEEENMDSSAQEGAKQSSSEEDSKASGEADGSEAGNTTAQDGSESDASENSGEASRDDQGSSQEQGSSSSAPENTEASPSSAAGAGQEASVLGGGGAPSEGEQASAEEDSPALPHCDSSTDKRIAAADAAGIERASDSERSIAKKNTVARIVEERKKRLERAGTSTGDDFLALVQKQMTPPKVPWQNIFRKALGKNTEALTRGKANYSYRRVNRRSHDSQYIFPGMIQYVPKLMFAIDTSGSMDTTDYNALLSEVEGIIRSTTKGKDTLKVFSVDAQVKNISSVSSVKDIDLRGGGGTDMSRGVAYVNELPPRERPDIFVLATDGGTNWSLYERELRRGSKFYHHILLVTTQGGYDSVPASIKRLATVVNISRDTERSRF